ncbi:hypothetical protein [Pseudokineococcus lusitanus]|uniref:Uncharacterized protein n=1 Tax=Pseudokineococcus lusitanus TaxID=763993 RepID=A0A3N1HJX1_9ACTN|nr:hypothetical protein [Pseudokineococcus lusitanus]ROP42806.1 hypothetical protein EDC03_2093 [Pseudokineococcus lusitanus]
MSTRPHGRTAAPATGPDADDAALDPREALALLESERDRTQQHLEPDARLIYGVWGVAWLVGFLALWSASTGAGPLSRPVAFVVFGGLLAVAVVVTAVHSIRRTAGLRGGSAAVGAMYGWAWLLGFGGLFAVMQAAAAAGASPEVLNVLGPALPALVVGLLYLAGGALWQERVQYALGAWIIATGAVAALTGWPTNELVMALLGGGGFLVGAVVVALAGRRSA